MAKATILTGSQRNEEFELSEGGVPVVIGRGSEFGGVVLHDLAVSRIHSELVFQDGRWAIRDLGSSNGTFVNEKKAAGEVLLNHNDQIRVGATVILFESQERSEAQKGVKESAAAEPDVESADTMVGLSVDNLGSKEVAERRERIAQAGQTAVNLSHGIKNLLQAVATGREVVGHGLKTGDIERVKRGWNILNRNLERIHKLVVDMLKFSKESKAEFKSCHFNRLVESIVETLRSTAEENGVSTSVQTGERVGMAEIDSDKMQDVIMNLVLNAIEAAAAVEIGVVNVTTGLESGGEQLVFEVSDNGPGIGDTDSIFLPFHSAKPKVGTGLGLAITKKIVEQHNGTIEVKSEVGKGATFTVRLPVSQVGKNG
jgi:signal transduction histidine kinase